jgi:hypothetical protein
VFEYVHTPYGGYTAPSLLIVEDTRDLALESMHRNLGNRIKYRIVLWGDMEPTK